MVLDEINKNMEQGDSSSFSVPADKAEVGRITAFIDEFLIKHNVNDKIIHQIDVAVDEICSNIFNYAYKGKKGKVTTEIIYKDHNVSISFIDHGKQFNPLEKEDPDVSLSLEERQVGGLGIYMVKQLMDDVLYHFSENKENVLTIIKKVGE